MSLVGRGMASLCGTGEEERALQVVDLEPGVDQIDATMAVTSRSSFRISFNSNFLTNIE